MTTKQPSLIDQADALLNDPAATSIDLAAMSRRVDDYLRTPPEPVKGKSAREAVEAEIQDETDRKVLDRLRGMLNQAGRDAKRREAEASLDERRADLLAGVDAIRDLEQRLADARGDLARKAQASKGVYQNTQVAMPVETARAVAEVLHPGEDPAGRGKMARGLCGVD